MPDIPQSKAHCYIIKVVIEHNHPHSSLASSPDLHTVQFLIAHCIENWMVGRSANEAICPQWSITIHTAHNLLTRGEMC